VNRVRKALQPTLSVLGMVVVFLGVLLVPPSNPRLQIWVVLAGVLILEAGVWRLAARLLPSTRRYLSLRAEVEGFMGLVPELNEAAVERDGGADGGEERFLEALSLMHDSVDRMGEVASKEG